MAREGLGLEITELRLGLPCGEPQKNEKKRMFSEIDGVGEENGGSDDRKITEKKNQVVGWPPVCSYRKKNMNEGSKMYMKVSMDGAPYLRKIDLGLHKGYLELALALEKLFGCCGIGKLHIFHSFFLYFIFKSFLLFNLLHDLLMVAI
jgi:auxin-responsive protein IAA